jgi:hypothetical protein
MGIPGGRPGSKCSCSTCLFFCDEGPHSVDATDAPQSWGLSCYPVMKMISFFPFFSCNGAPVERNWQRKTEVLGEKPVPVLLCPPQIPRGPSRDRTRTSTVKGQRLRAWLMTRPFDVPYIKFQIPSFPHASTATLVHVVVSTSASVVMLLVTVSYGLKIWSNVETNLCAADRPDDNWRSLHGWTT